MKKISILSFVIFIIIFLRCILDKIPQLTYIVAGINIVAIIYVLYTIIERIVSNLDNRIYQSGIPVDIENREIKSIEKRFWTIGICVSLIVIIIYFLFWCSNLGNDIISILALGISILDEDLVKAVSDNYKI